MNQFETEVFNTVGAFLGAYAGKNLQSCLSYIATDTPLLIMGTNDDEVITSYEEVAESFAADFSIMDGLTWGDLRYSYVKAESGIGSMIIELPITYTNEGKQSTALFRYALTLVQQNKAWKICAFLTSVPYKSGNYDF